MANRKDRSNLETCVGASHSQSSCAFQYFTHQIWDPGDREKLWLPGPFSVVRFSTLPIKFGIPEIVNG